MREKHLFTLIEVIISLFLITLVITFLFGFFTRIAKAEKQIEEIKKEVYQKNNFQIHLSNIFTQLYSKNYDQSPFYTEYDKNKKNLCLHVNFDNGVDPDPNYSHIIEAKIYVDEKNDLILEMFSKDEKTKISRRKILFTNIKKFKCKFLSCNDLDMKPYIIEQINNNYFWYNFWPEKNKGVPFVVYIKINNDPDFAFFLPSQGVKI